MKEGFLIVVINIILTLNIFSQNNYTCEVVGNPGPLPEKDILLHYIPTDTTSMKYVKVNFHFMMKSDSTLNFRPYDDGLGNCSFNAYDYSKMLITYINLRLAINQHMNLPPGNNTPVLARYYRLVLKGVYFHYDDNAYAYGSLSSSEIAYYSINPSSEINIFFVYDPNPNYSGGGTAHQSGDRYVIKKAVWQKYRDHGTVGVWADAWGIIHETGHNFVLSHTMHNPWGVCCDTCDDGCADTPTITDIVGMGYPDPCPHWGDTASTKSNNVMDYSGITAITPEQLGIVHYTLTHNMSSYLETDPPISFYPETVITENQNILWQNDTTMTFDIKINNGGTLCIKDCTLQMSSNSHIIIKPGGKLIVDGGHLTSLCADNVWPGIEVWGDSSTHQYIINGVCGQGRLELKNGAIIENAICAVELWHPGDTTTTGGIVHADSTVFRNNTKAVHALHYTNHRPTDWRETEYISDFTNCVFVIDNNYLGADVFCQHVDFECVNGIDFKGCAFSVNGTTQGVSSTSCGIDAYNAGFRVLSYCSDKSITGTSPCPEEYVVRSSFSGFHDGVRSVSDGTSTRSFSVHDALFSGNDRGVFAQNTVYATLLRNSFLVGGKADCSYGVYAEEVTGFCIEENSFMDGIGEGTKYGIGVFNCGGNNDIYRNSFEDLDCGNLSVGQNATRVGGFSSGSITSGLTYSCNHNSDNAIDFCVLKDGSVGGIYPYQGSSTAPAGNTFDGSLYHFYNDGEWTVNYCYYSGEPDQFPSGTKIHGMTLTSTNSVNKCVNHYGSVIKSPEEKSQLEKEYLTSNDWHERYLAAGDIVRSDLHDTIANLEELRTWLANTNEISADRTAIASYIQEGDFDNALKLAEQLPNRYQLESDCLLDHLEYMQLLVLHRTLHATHRTVAQLSDSERKMVESIAKEGSGFSKSMATAMLRGFSDEPTYSCPTLPSGTRGVEGFTGIDQLEVSDFSVSVIPNPASTMARVEYTLPEGSQQASLDLVNIFGEKVMSVVMKGQSGSKTVMLDSLPKGVYNYFVLSGNAMLCGKLVIVH